MHKSMHASSALEALAEVAMTYQSQSPVAANALSREGRPTGAAEPEGGNSLPRRSTENRSIPKPRTIKTAAQFCHPPAHHARPFDREQPMAQCPPALGLTHPTLGFLNPGTMATHWKSISTQDGFPQATSHASSYSAFTGAPPVQGFTPWLQPGNTGAPPYLPGQLLQHAMPSLTIPVGVPPLGDQVSSFYSQAYASSLAKQPTLSMMQLPPEALQITHDATAYNHLQSALVQMRQRTQSTEVCSIDAQALAAAHAARERAERQKAAFLESEREAANTATLKRSERKRKAPVAFDDMSETLARKRQPPGAATRGEPVVDHKRKAGRGRPRLPESQRQAPPSAPRRIGRPRKEVEGQPSQPTPVLEVQPSDAAFPERPSSGESQTANDRRRPVKNKRPPRRIEKTPDQLAAMTESRRLSGQLRAWIRSHKQDGLLTRMQRARARLLLSIFETPGCNEFDLRAIHGDDPDTSKALRILSEEGLVKRVGDGVKNRAFTYCALPSGKREAATSKALLAADANAQKAMAKLLPKHLLDHWRPSPPPSS